MNKALHKNLISLSLFLGIITLAACGAIFYLQYYRILEAYHNVIVSYQTIRAANQSLISIDEAALDVSTFLQVKDPETLKQIPQVINVAEVNFKTLKVLISDNQTQLELANKLTPFFEKKINFLNNITKEYISDNIQQAINISSDKNRLNLTQSIIQLIIAIKQEEIKQLNNENAILNKNKIMLYDLVLSIGVLSGLLFLFNFILLNNYLKKY